MIEQDTKAQILTTAMAVFTQKGFTKASMNDIVRASGLSKGGVYWHFKGKDEIIIAIFEQFFTEQRTQMEAILASDISAGAKLSQLAQLTGQAVEKWFVQFPHPLEFYAFAIRDTTLKNLMQQSFRIEEERLIRLVEQGIADGEFKEVDAGAIARTVIGIFEGILLLWSIKSTSFDLSKQVETAIQLLLEGIQQAN